MLEHLQCLKCVDLSDNLITDKNLSIVSSWPSQLETLNLSGNRFASYQVSFLVVIKYFILLLRNLRKIITFLMNILIASCTTMQIFCIQEIKINHQTLFGSYGTNRYWLNHIVLSISRGVSMHVSGSNYWKNTGSLFTLLKMQVCSYVIN